MLAISTPATTNQRDQIAADSEARAFLWCRARRQNQQPVIYTRLAAYLRSEGIETDLESAIEFARNYCNFFFKHEHDIAKQRQKRLNKFPFVDIRQSEFNRARRSLLYRRSTEWLRKMLNNRRPVTAESLALNLQNYFQIDSYDFYFEFASLFIGEMGDGIQV